MDDKFEMEKNTTHYIHFYLNYFVSYNKDVYVAEESLIEDWSFLDLINGRWKPRCISTETIELIKEFRREWLKYKKDNSFSNYWVFVFLDKNWINIVDNYLIPAIERLEKDMKDNNIEYATFPKYTVPTNDEIVESGKFLCDILLKHKIITIDYID